jgi:hypothetical protein
MFHLSFPRIELPPKFWVALLALVGAFLFRMVVTRGDKEKEREIRNWVEKELPRVKAEWREREKVESYNRRLEYLRRLKEAWREGGRSRVNGKA